MLKDVKLIAEILFYLAATYVTIQLYLNAGSLFQPTDCPMIEIHGGYPPP